MVVNFTAGAHTQDTIHVRRKQLVVVDEEELKVVGAVVVVAQANLISTGHTFDGSAQVLNLFDLRLIGRLPRFGFLLIEVLTETAAALGAFDGEPIRTGIVNDLDTFLLRTEVKRTSIDLVLIQAL